MSDTPDGPLLKGFGVCTHFERRDAGWKAEKLIPLIRQMGASVVRQEVDWRSVELERGQHRIPDVSRDWLNRASDAGLGVILVLCYGNDRYENPLDPQAYARYAAFMARECRDKPIVAYEIWNEPTNFAFLKQYGGSWSGKPPCPWLDRYAELMAAAAPAIKEADPRAQVIINPGEAQFAHLVQTHPKALAAVDGTSHHPYPMRFPPETAAWGGAQIRERDGVDSADDDHSFLSIWRLTQKRCRQRLGREMELYATEFGYSTYNHHGRPAIFAGYTEPAQAAYLVRGIVLGFAAGLRSNCLYDFMDDGLERHEAEHNFGMVRHEQRGWESKPSYHAIRRLSQWLGSAWTFEPAPPVRLEVEMKPLPQNQDLWQAPVVEPHLRITAPQLFCFRTGSDLVAIFWRGGRISGEYNDPFGDLVWIGEGRSVQAVAAEDLATGQSLPLQAQAEGGRVRWRDLPVGGTPVAVRWRL
jgi:hypothetical protein